MESERSRREESPGRTCLSDQMSWQQPNNGSEEGASLPRSSSVSSTTFPPWNPHITSRRKKQGMCPAHPTMEEKLLGVREHESAEWDCWFLRKADVIKRCGRTEGPLLTQTGLSCVPGTVQGRLRGRAQAEHYQQTWALAGYTQDPWKEVLKNTDYLLSPGRTMIVNILKYLE